MFSVYAIKVFNLSHNNTNLSVFSHVRLYNEDLYRFICLGTVNSAINFIRNLVNVLIDYLRG